VKGERGYTLVETMIAMLLVALVVTSIFSMVVTAKMGAKKSGNQAQAHFFARQQMEKLKSYVSADLSAPGPRGSGGTAPANWVFPGDASGGYALQAGNHDVTSNLPASLRSLGWTMSYTVTDTTCGTKTCKKVDVNVGWPGP
jgi:prepilin-type N-terminal cleavage/methylation domain-containing protein